MTWPYPGDSPLARARRLTHAYRAALANADPDGCHDLDHRAREWGETWITPGVVLYDLDDWLTPTEAADIACVRPAQLREWRRRSRITGRQRTDGTWEYQARDILTLMAEVRRRPRQLRSQQRHPHAQNTGATQRRRRRPAAAAPS